MVTEVTNFDFHHVIWHVESGEGLASIKLRTTMDIKYIASSYILCQMGGATNSPDSLCFFLPF